MKDANCSIVNSMVHMLPYCSTWFLFFKSYMVMCIWFPTATVFSRLIFHPLQLTTHCKCCDWCITFLISTLNLFFKILNKATCTVRVVVVGDWQGCSCPHQERTLNFNNILCLSVEIARENMNCSYMQPMLWKAPSTWKEPWKEEIFNMWSNFKIFPFVWSILWLKFEWFYFYFHFSRMKNQMSPSWHQTLKFFCENFKVLWLFEEKVKKFHIKYKILFENFENLAIVMHCSMKHHGVNQIPISFYG